MINRSKCRFNKRAQLVELLVSLVLIFVFVVITLFANKTLSSFNDEIVNDTSINNNTRTTVSNLNDSYSDVFDGLTVVVLVGMLAISIVAGYFSATKPAVLVFFFIALIFVLVVAGVLSNTWNDITTDAEVNAISTNYPITNYVLNNYILFIAIIGVSGIVSAFVGGRLGGD